MADFHNFRSYWHLASLYVVPSKYLDSTLVHLVQAQVHPSPGQVPDRIPWNRAVDTTHLLKQQYYNHRLEALQHRTFGIMSYRFTYPNSNLTQEQKDFYEKNGYILIKNNVGDALVEKVTQRFVDICDGNVKDYFVDTIMKDPSLKHKDNVRGQYLINKLQDFAYDEVFWEYCKDPGVISIVEGIIGPNITAVHSMFINKPPNADPGASLHPLHQDLHYFPFRPANKIVASWTALERVDERNGCLYVVPGSHESTLYKHEYPKGFKNALYHGIQGFDHLPKVHVVMDKGDTVFFHPLLLHGSGPNFTKGFRKAISCHYANTKDTYFIDVRGTTQESIATEIETIVQTKRGLNLSYANVWKLKSRLVKGEPGVYQQLDSLL